MSPLKKSVLTLLTGATFLICPSSYAGPRFAGGDVTFSATAGVTDTNRASPSALGSSDTILQFTPAVSFSRSSNRMDLNANLSFPIQRYDKNDALDSENISFGLNGEIPFGNGPKLSGNWGVSYFKGIQASFLSNRNLDSTNFSVNAYADYVLQRRLSFRTRASYNDRDNSGVGSTFSNANSSTMFAAGLHARELIRGRIGLYAEYVLQERKTGTGLTNEGIDDSDDGINFGITGQLLPERLFPKLDADLSFGYTSTSASDRVVSGRGNGNSDRFTLNGSLAYPANAKTNVALTFSRNLSVTDDDRTVETSQVALSVDYSPQPKLGFSGSIGLSSNDYVYDVDSRNDDVFTATLSARYTIRPNWFSTLSLNQRDTSSNVAISDYTSTQISLSSTIQY